ncbi:hypothetical protein K443DRAFT_682681, partial [Laccaria amethystina LaAM-08-1]
MNPHIYDGYPRCDHEHHLYANPNTNPHANSDASPNVTVNQTRTPPNTRTATTTTSMKRAMTRAPACQPDSLTTYTMAHYQRGDVEDLVLG